MSNRKNITLDIDVSNTAASNRNTNMRFTELSWPWGLNHIEIALVPESIVSNSALKVEIGGIEYEAVIGTDDATAVLGGIEVPAGGTVTMVIKPTNCQIYRSLTGMGTVFGARTYTGGSYYTVRSKLVVSYIPLMVNNGYLGQYMTYGDVEDISWSGFDKDSDGYPYNDGVWKFDAQNGGYPWIVGYEKARPTAGNLLLYDGGQAVPVNLMMYENGQAVPVGIMLYV